MKKLVIVADDFGFLPSVNDGIEYLFKNSPVIEISLVTNAKYTLEALKIAKKHKIQNLGIHIELLGSKSLGRPVTTSDYTVLYQEKSYEDIEILAKEEIKEFERLVGKTPTHITSHKGIHGNFKLLNYLINYARGKNIPIRKPITALNVELGEQNYAAEISLKRAGLKSSNYLIAHMLGNDSNVTKKAYIDDLAKLKDGESAEIITHPAFFDENLLNHSALNYLRTRDISIFTDKIFLNKITKMGFEICSYKDL